MPELTPKQVTQFVEDGFVRLPAAFPRSLADDCREILWAKSGVDPEDRSSWRQPVVRIGGCAEEPFRLAANTPRLHGAFDQLVGIGRWTPPAGLGTFPIRFPHPDDPGDAGWHLDGSYAVDGDPWPWVNLRSRERALLMLFLLSDVGPDDAPTRIKVGSHLDVPPFLAPAGEEGMSMLALCQTMDRAGRLDSADRALALATGEAGDVYLCHPFLIHAAQPHRGTEPRFIAQPPLHAKAPLDLDTPTTPVERAVHLALAASA
jgi:hypothetical protein